MQLGIGLHAGLAVVGNIGSADRVQYTAIGDTVNVAARLVDLARPQQIIVSEKVWEAISNRDSLEPVGEVKLKGRQDQVKIYLVRWTDEPQPSSTRQHETATGIM
jgi:adenylate cyclase